MKENGPATVQRTNHKVPASLVKACEMFRLSINAECELEVGYKMPRGYDLRHHNSEASYQF